MLQMIWANLASQLKTVVTQSKIDVVYLHGTNEVLGTAHTLGVLYDETDVIGVVKLVVAHRYSDRKPIKHLT